MSEERIENLVILGSGPAGLTAALYAARAQLEPLVIAGLEEGGQLTLTTDIENFPGFPQGIGGPQLIQEIRAQAERFGTRFQSGNVESIDTSTRPFTLKLEAGEVKARAVIIATGATARRLGIPGEDENFGKGVSTCATCDGFFFRGAEVVMVGGGDSAMEEATFMTRFAERVTLVHRRDEFRASKIMQQRVLDNPKIAVIWDTTLTEVLSDASGVTGVKARNVKTGEVSVIPSTGFFLAIGHIPNTGFLKGTLDMDGEGYLQYTKLTYTSVEGIFAAGDVADSRYRQAITAAGSGCQAAIDAERWLESQER